ncbi:MAG: hypothetical protein DME00_31675 [Candidatus Rokuibacteriota bacterium]|nr:MAG: hypothetical protein DME00_31675 [Candidatus Rokubacteria bacterium]
MRRARRGNQRRGQYASPRARVLDPAEGTDWCRGDGSGLLVAARLLRSARRRLRAPVRGDRRARAPGDHRRPRLDTPRTKTPPGSVGIGGIQCCIYSVESPGGFWILGRTPVSLYDPSASEPTLLRPGDRVRFRRIDRAEFDSIGAAVAARAYRPVIA